MASFELREQAHALWMAACRMQNNIGARDRRPKVQVMRIKLEEIDRLETSAEALYRALARSGRD